MATPWKRSNVPGKLVCTTHNEFFAVGRGRCSQCRDGVSVVDPLSPAEQELIRAAELGLPSHLEHEVACYKAFLALKARAEKLMTPRRTRDRKGQLTKQLAVPSSQVHDGCKVMTLAASFQLRAMEAARAREERAWAARTVRESARRSSSTAYSSPAPRPAVAPADSTTTGSGVH